MQHPTVSRHMLLVEGCSVSIGKCFVGANLLPRGRTPSLASEHEQESHICCSGEAD